MSLRSALPWTSALVALVAVGGFGLWWGVRPSKPTQHVLIISIESLRWDHLGLAGYERPTSPNIDALAARGAYFQRAYSQAPWTRPSIASTFTSTYPSTHQAANDTRFGTLLEDREDTPEGMENTVMASLSASFDTLAEVFTARGFQCFGWSWNPQIWSGLGFAQGFGQYRAVGVNDEQIVANLDEVFARQDRDPTMVFLHLMTPHLPYTPEERFRRFGSTGCGTRITGENQQKINSGELEITAEDIACNINLYDATILETDDRVRRILEALERHGVAEETLIVLTADHGEEFLDHGMVGHGQSAYEELIHVPMVFVGPNIIPGRTIDIPVQNIDLLPTLAGLLWGEQLREAQGRDLSRTLRRRKSPPERLVFSESGVPGYFCAVIHGDFKLILYPDSNTALLYDLAADPGELHDLSDHPNHQARKASLTRAARTHLAANFLVSEEHNLDPLVDTPDVLIEQLRALGYVDGAPSKQK